MNAKTDSICPQSFVSVRTASWFFAFVFHLALVSGTLYGQAAPVQVPANTPLSIQLAKHVPMKAGEDLQGRLLYPVYVENRIAIPAGATLRGTITRLNPNRSRRTHARLRGDLTPFHTPVVKFDQLVLPGGGVEAIASGNATDGVPILRLSTPPAQKKGSFISRQIAQQKQRVKDTIAQFTAPGRGDRLVQLIYTQLPYHPERIETGTAWTLNLAQPLDLGPATPWPEEGQSRSTAPQKPVATGPTEDLTEWRLHAYLQQTISSADQNRENSFRPRSPSQSSTRSTPSSFPRVLCLSARSHKANVLVRLAARESSVFDFES